MDVDVRGIGMRPGSRSESGLVVTARRPARAFIAMSCRFILISTASARAMSVRWMPDMIRAFKSPSALLDVGEQLDALRRHQDALCAPVGGIGLPLDQPSGSSRSMSPRQRDLADVHASWRARSASCPCRRDATDWRAPDHCERVTPMGPRAWSTTVRRAWRRATNQDTDPGRQCVLLADEGAADPWLTEQTR